MEGLNIELLTFFNLPKLACLSESATINLNLPIFKFLQK